MAVAAVLSVGVGLVTWRVIAARRVGAHDLTSVQLGTIGIVYPTAYARFPAGRGGGRLDRVDLAITVPDFHAAGATTASLPADDDVAARVSSLVFLTIRPEDEAIDPQDRTEKIHARFLEPGVWQEESGLVMRRFEKGSPYDHEELHFVPPDGRVFAARCVRPTQPPSDLPSTCLSTFRIDGLDIDVRFPPALLPQWEPLIDGTRNLVQSFRHG